MVPLSEALRWAFPLLSNALAILLLCCKLSVVSQPGDTVEAFVIGLAGACVLAALPAVRTMLADGFVRAPVRCFLTAVILPTSCAGIALCVYNFQQGSYFLEECYSPGWKLPCESPRYVWYDVVYELGFRERCLLSRMEDSTPWELKDMQCYSVFMVRGPQCLGLFGKCFATACVLGAFFVFDSQPLVPQRVLDEDEIVSEAYVQQRVQGCLPDQTRHVAALTDT